MVFTLTQNCLDQKGWCVVVIAMATYVPHKYCEIQDKICHCLDSLGHNNKYFFILILQRRIYSVNETNLVITLEEELHKYHAVASEGF